MWKSCFTSWDSDLDYPSRKNKGAPHCRYSSDGLLLPSYSNFHPVLHSKADVIPAVDCHEFHHAVPEQNIVFRDGILLFFRMGKVPFLLPPDNLWMGIRQSCPYRSHSAHTHGINSCVRHPPSCRTDVVETSHPASLFDGERCLDCRSRTSDASRCTPAGQTRQRTDRIPPTERIRIDVYPAMHTSAVGLGGQPALSVSGCPRSDTVRRTAV